MRLDELIEELERARVWARKAGRADIAENLGKACVTLRQIPDLVSRANDRDAALKARDAAIVRAEAAEAKMLEMEGHPDVKVMRRRKLEAARAQIEREIERLDELQASAGPENREAAGA